jgi:hypothetical protein
MDDEKDKRVQKYVRLRLDKTWNEFEVHTTDKYSWMTF